MQQPESKREPTTRVHFKNAAARAKFEAGTMTMSEARAATVQVPLKKGMDRNVRKQLISNMKYAQKVNDPRWQVRAAEIRAEREGKILPKGQTGHE